MLDSIPSQSSESELDLVDYLEIILMRKKFIIRVTLCAFLLSIFISLFLTKIYASTARILPPQMDQSLMGLMMGQMGGGLSTLAGSVLGAGTVADQYASMLKSERIKDAIIDRFKLMDEYDIEYRVYMQKELDKIVKIKAGKKDGIIVITAEDKDPQKAADIANAFIDELGKLLTEISTSNAGQNRVFLASRLARARADLAQAEDSMKLFQLKNKTIDVTQQAKASIEGIATLKSQLVFQENQLSALRSQYTDSAKEVKFVKATISDLTSQIAKLEGTGTGAIPPISSVPNLGQEQVRLLREFKTQEMLVELLSKQYELAKLTEANQVAAIQVVQKARPSDKKIRPKRMLIVMFSTFIAFACSVSLVLFADYKEKMPKEEIDRWRTIKSLLWKRND